MTTAQTELDETLLANLNRQDSFYGRALEIAAKLPESFKTGQHRDELLQEFALVSLEISRIDLEMIGAKELYFETGHKPSPRLNQTMANIKSKIEQLIKLIDRSEHIAREVKQRLTPEMDIQTRVQRMRRAYATTAEPREVD